MRLARKEISLRGFEAALRARRSCARCGFSCRPRVGYAALGFFRELVRFVLRCRLWFARLKSIAVLRPRAQAEVCISFTPGLSSWLGRHMVGAQCALGSGCPRCSSRACGTPKRALKMHRRGPLAAQSSCGLLQSPTTTG